MISMDDVLAAAKDQYPDWEDWLEVEQDIKEIFHEESE